MKVSAIALLALLTLVGHDAPAAETERNLAAIGAAAPSYPLRQAVDDALARHPLLAVSAAARAAAGYQREAAEWGRYPTVTADIAPGTARNTTYLLRIDQPLWAGGRIQGQIDVARAGEAATAIDEREARRLLSEQTAVAYMGWLGAQERLHIAVEGRGVFERLLSYVQRRQVAGAAALSDVSVAVARLALAGAQREQLASELERARAELQLLVVGPLGEGEPIAVPDFTVVGAQDVEAAYLVNSTAIDRRRAEIDAARAAELVARGQMYPTLSLRLERLQQSNPSAQQPNDSRAMLALQFAPGAGLSAGASSKAAESRVRAAEEQVRVDELDVRLRARSQWEEHRSAKRQQTELRPQIEALQSTADSYMRQFEAGRRGWIDVLNIQREALDARLALSRVDTQHHQSALRLMANTQGLQAWINTTPR